MRLQLNVDVCGEECEPPSDHLGGEVAKGRSRDKSTILGPYVHFTLPNDTRAAYVLS